VKAAGIITLTLFGLVAAYLLSFPFYLVALEHYATRKPTYYNYADVPDFYIPASRLTVVAPAYRAYCRWCLKMFL
jgi:hypothetical protein